VPARFFALLCAVFVLTGAVAPVAAAEARAAALVQADEPDPTLVTDPPAVAPAPPVRVWFPVQPEELAGRQHCDRIFRPPRAAN
jgi:hypothetical protein